MRASNAVCIFKNASGPLEVFSKRSDFAPVDHGMGKLCLFFFTVLIVSPKVCERIGLDLNFALTAGHHATSREGSKVLCVDFD